MSESLPGAGADAGLVLLDEGKPQQVLAKYVHLMLNYRFGLSLSLAQDVNRAVTLVSAQGHAIKCVVIIQNTRLRDRELLAALSRRDTVPVFVVLPGRLLERQRSLWEGMSSVCECAWETAFTHGDASLQQLISDRLGARGMANLLRDLEQEPYETVRRRVAQRLRHINTLPTLPEIVMRIMRLVSDPETTTEQLEELLCRDPAIVMKLLQVIRSPVFAASGRRANWSLNEIIVRLGLKKVGAIAQQIKLVNSLVRPEESAFDLRRFWEHSVGCAVIADRLYERGMVHLPGPVEFNQYWIAALLHDVGKLVLGFFFWDWFERVTTGMERAQFRFRKVEAQMGDVANHEHVGQLLLVQADMGETLADAVGRHHAPGSEPSALICLVHMANNLCKDLGMGYLPEERGTYDADVLDRLRLNTAAPAQLCEQLSGEIAREVSNMVDQCL